MDIFSVVVILVLLIGAPAIVVNRDALFFRRSSRRVHGQMPLPYLIVPSHPGGPRIIPAGVARSSIADEPRMPREATSATQVPSAVPATPTMPLNHSAHEPRIGDAEEPDQFEADEQKPSPDATVVFKRPADEPVQILPGRLHILSGDATGEDLHLFRKLGEPARIVVGREQGPPHRHITLRSPTVSRRHARMDWVNGSWTITNLSSTNPVLVNNHALKNGTTARKLSDGDRIELGEVALRFLAS